MDAPEAEAIVVGNECAGRDAAEAWCSLEALPLDAMRKEKGVGSRCWREKNGAS